MLFYPLLILSVLHPPRCSLFLIWHHGTPGPHWSWGHSRLKRVTSVVKQYEILFFSAMKRAEGFLVSKGSICIYIYIYPYEYIYIGSREMIFEIFSLRSCCLMKWRLFQMVSFQIEAYQSAVGSFCWIFLLHRFLWQKRRVQVGNPAFLTSSIDMSELGWSEGCMK